MQLSYDRGLMTSNDDVNHLHWGRVWWCRPESKILPEVVSATISVQREREAFLHVVDVASGGTGYHIQRRQYAREVWRDQVMRCFRPWM
jgi:hypothetical protein